MAPQSYAKVVRANMIERRVTTFVQSKQHQHQHPPAMSTSPSKYVDCPAEFSPAPPAVTDAAPPAFTPVPSKKQRKQRNFAKKDGVYQNGFVKTPATFKPKSDDFDFVIDAKGNDINENGCDKNDAINGVVENGAHENAKNGAIKEADKNDAINGVGKESAKNDHGKHAISKLAETKSNDFVVNLDVDSSINENVDDNLKAVEHPPKSDNLPVPINKNDKHVEADKINSSTDNSSTDEEKNENDNHLENGHLDPDVHNHNGGDYVERGSSQGSNRFTVEDFQRLLFENSEGLYRMLGNEESFERFNNFLKLMELSGGMELFCDVFENGEEHQHLPNIDPQQPLPELGRLPREKLDRAFRQLKKSMIQSYNSRIFFPQVSAPHFYPNPAAIEFHPNAQPLSIISAPSSAKSPHKIPTQKQIARRLTSCATAKSQQSHPQQQQQHQSLQQQQLQCYIDPAHFDHQQQYFHGTQFQQLPPPTSTAIVPMHTPQQQLQPLTTTTTTAVGTYPQYLQAAPYHTYQPPPLPLATTNYTAVDFAQYINQRNMALLDELRANETMLSNLLYTG